MAALVLWPLGSTGRWYQSHENIRYFVLLDLFHDALRHGVWYPRILPDLYGGYGHPTFLFYQPGFFFFVFPFTLLPLAFYQALLLALVSLAWLGGLGAFQLGRELGGRSWGLFAAAWFLLTPYLYVDLYVRGDLSEWMGALLCPWPVFWLLRLARRLREGGASAGAMLGCAASIFAVILSHPVPPVLLLPALCALALVLGWGTRIRGALALRFGVSLLLGVALSSPYWLTVLQMRDVVHFELLTGDFYQPEQHTVEPARLLSRRWGFGGANDDPEDDVVEMSYQLGALHFVLATLGAWAGRRSRPVLWAYASYLLLLLWVLPPSSVVWERAGPLRNLQFPWRLLSVTATLQLVASLGLARVPAPPLARATALLAGTAFALWWHADQFALRGVYNFDPSFILERYHESLKREGFRDFAAVDAFLPKTARERPPEPRDFDAPVVRLLGSGAVEALPHSDPHHLRFRVEHRGPATIAIDRLYVPGWHVLVDDRLIPRSELESRLTPTGLIRIDVSGTATRRVEAHYAGPPGQRLRDAGILLAVLGFLVYLRLGRSPGGVDSATGVRARG